MEKVVNIRMCDIIFEPTKGTNKQFLFLREVMFNIGYKKEYPILVIKVENRYKIYNGKLRAMVALSLGMNEIPAIVITEQEAKEMDKFPPPYIVQPINASV